METWSWRSKEFLVATFLLGLVSIIGIIGNGLVVAIIKALRGGGHKSTVQLFLLHLAISDLMVCFLCIPLTILANFYYPTSAELFDNILCKFVRFIQFISPTISIAVLPVISIDRYLSLAKPMTSKAPRPFFFRPHWMITFAWIFSLAQFLPTFYFSSLMPINVSNHTIYYCTPIPNQSIAGKAFLLVLFVASFVLPLGTMTVLYYRVARVVWNRSRELSASSRSQVNAAILESSRRRVVRMLLIVVAVFMVCWTPFIVYSGFLEERIKAFPNPMDRVRLSLYGLGLFNSICNPFIYYFSGGNFHLSDIKTLLCGKTSQRRSSSNTSAMPLARSERKLSIPFPFRTPTVQESPNLEDNTFMTVKPISGSKERAASNVSFKFSEEKKTGENLESGNSVSKDLPETNV